MEMQHWELEKTHSSPFKPGFQLLIFFFHTFTVSGKIVINGIVIYIPHE